MNKLTDKIELIYLPFLIIAICFIGGYTFLNWLLIIKLHLFSVKEELVNIWLPLALPWIPLLIWLRPRIKLLHPRIEKANLPMAFTLMAGLAIIVPTSIAQSYLESETGKLTPLATINQINKKVPTKYYSLKDFYIYTRYPGIYNTFDVSGKYGERLNMDLFVVLPILATQADTASPICKAWYGIKYEERISNRLNDHEKQKRFEEFMKRIRSDFDHKIIPRFIYLESLGNSENYEKYNKAIHNVKNYSSNSKIILVPYNEPFEARNENKFVWIFGSFGIGAFIFLLLLLITKLNEEVLEKFRSGEKAWASQLKTPGFLSFIIPKSDLFITQIIIELNVLIYLIMVFAGLGSISFRAVDLLAWGANYRPLTANGEWWRLLTSTFLHGGVIHLCANMCGLLFVGVFLEPRLGRNKYASAYLFTGIMASISSLLWHDASVSVGASGAIFGLYGIFLALLLTKAFPRSFSKIFIASTLIFIGYNFIVGFVGGVDNAAHVGGLLTGLILGFILSPQLKADVVTKQTAE